MRRRSTARARSYCYIYIISLIINIIVARDRNFVTIKTARPPAICWTDSPDTSPSTPNGKPAQHSQKLPATMHKEFPYSADNVRQEARQQNVLRADSEHDQQQPFEAHDVAFRADRKCPADRKHHKQTTTEMQRKSDTLDEAVSFGAQAAFRDAINFRVQPQYAVQHLLLLHRRLHVELNLVDDRLKVPASGGEVEEMRAQ